MKIKKLLFALLVIPVALGAQSNRIFYNQGKMYVGEKATATAADYETSVLTVKGSMNFTTGSEVATAAKSAINLTGDFESTVPTAAAKQHIFVSTVEKVGATPVPQSGALGAIYFVNEETTTQNMQIARLTGVPATPVALMPLDLGLTKKQTIKMTSTDKVNHFITMPRIHAGVQSLATGALATAYKGRHLVLDAGLAVASPYIQPSHNGLVTLETKYTTGVRRLDSPYILGVLDAKGFSYAAGQNLSDVKGLGTVVRDIKTYDAMNLASNILSSSANHKEVMLTGFTPTSRYWYGDNMLYNLLLRPENESFTGWGGLVSSSTFEMGAGYGYFMAQDIFPDDIYAQVTAQYPTLDKSERSVGGYVIGGRSSVLDKSAAARGKTSFNTAGLPANVNKEVYSKEASPFIGEAIGGAGKAYEAKLQLLSTTHIAPIKVRLKRGINYLGNPFTAPLDLKSFVTTGTLGAEWGNVVGGGAINVSTANTADIRALFYVVNAGEVRYNQTSDGGRFQYTVLYHNAQTHGGTIDLPANSSDYHVGPMQLFCLQATKDIDLILPPSKAGFSKVKTTRSASEVAVDELLFQAVVYDNVGEDEIQLSEDRLCVVMRDNADLNYSDPYDTRKLITNSKVTKSGTGTVLKTTKNGVTNTSTYSGLIYTKSGEGYDMMSNFIPTSTTKLDMYFAPTAEVKNVRVTPYRMDSWQSIKTVWLEDKLGDRSNGKSTFVEIAPGAVYNSISMPGDQEDRFVIHFNKKPIDGRYTPIQVEEKPITCYYNNGMMYIRDLIQDDINSKVEIIDMRGNTVGKTVIDLVPSITHPTMLSQGTYIVKITGKRNFTAKIVSLQN